MCGRRKNDRRPLVNIIGAGGVTLGFIALVISVLSRSDVGKATIPALTEVEGPGTSDVHQIGELLFSTYWFPVQIVGVLLLVATVGVVVLSKKELK